MDYFNNFSSNSTAGSSNQLYFTMEKGEVRKGRIFYKIFAGGKYNYSLLFSNIIDSTYSDGSISNKNLLCSQWQIHSAGIGRCKSFPQDYACAADIMNENEKMLICDFKELKFDSKTTKTVMPGEFFSSDAVEMEFCADEYLCLEIEFSGSKIPYHEESLLPCYTLQNGRWEYSKLMPFAGMIGCDRKIRSKIGYIGDSITQGIGTGINSHEHWNHILSKKTGTEYSYWNLGIGYGKAKDVASNGAWMFKAKKCDVLFVCLGVNDLLFYRDENGLKNDLAYIVDCLRAEGKKIILQTVPPFDYDSETAEKWERINHYIKTGLSGKVDFVYDNNTVLGAGKGKMHLARYGGHPDSDGCKAWADDLHAFILENDVL